MIYRWLMASILLLAIPTPLMADSVELVDDSGQQLVFTTPPRRIVTLAPHLAEQVFDVGAGDRLVGTVEWSNKPDAARNVPRIGDSFRIDAERIVALQPDVILAWGGGTPAGTIERLRALQLPVAVLTPENLASIPRHLRWLGKLTGKIARAEKKATTFEAELDRLERQYANSETLDVFYQISAEPLFTVGAGHTISELVAVCGGKNIFLDLDSRAHSVSREAVLGRNPQAIVAGRYEGSDDELAGWLRWKDLAATRAGNLLSIDAETVARPTAGIIEGGRALCEALDVARENLRRPAG